MTKKIEIGDVVKVTDSGYQYTTYTEKAIELKANVSKYVYDCWKNGKRLDYKHARQERKCAWIYDDRVNEGDVCKVVNMSSFLHILIERIYDGRQFILEDSGLEIYEKKELFGDKDFLI